MTNTAKSVGVDQRLADQNPTQNRPQISQEGRKWIEENSEAIKSINEWVAKNGLPLRKYRSF